MVLWVGNLELVFELVVVEEEPEGRYVSVSLRQARLGRGRCAPWPKMVASEGGCSPRHFRRLAKIVRSRLLEEVGQ